MIVIIGASKGIGKYLYEKYKVIEKTIGSYCNDEKEKLIYVDVTRIEILSLLINTSSPNIKNYVVINCAGINYNSFAHKADLNKWHDVIDVNLKGTFNVINAFLPIMRKQGYGRIINLSSVVGQMGVMGTSAYAASKSALTGMIKSIAIENASKGITINNLNLGYFNTGMINEIPDQQKEQIKKSIPTGEFGNPENIYNAVEFLRKSDYITGSSIDINGGLL